MTNLLPGLAVLALVFGASCNKQTDCKANIRCIDENGEPVKNTSVLLYAQVKSPKSSATYTADVKANGKTDENGLVTFVFKLPAIFDIQATANTGTANINGSGIVKLEEGKATEKTVSLK